MAKERGATSSQNPVIERLAAEIQADLAEIINKGGGSELVGADDSRMTAAKRDSKVSFTDALQGYFPERGIAALDSDLRGMFETLSGHELVEAVIERVQRYAKDTIPEDEDTPEYMRDDFGWLAGYGTDEFKKIIRDELRQYISGFIADKHREFIVRCHARGLSTSDAVWELMTVDETMNRLAQQDAMGGSALCEILVHRLAYLKPGSARWPEKKYGSVWREERERYKQAICDIPFTSQVEQVALLAKLAERINHVLNRNVHSVKDLQILTHSLVKTTESLRKLSAIDEQQIPVSLSAPQLIGVLERLTLALKGPEQKAIGGETQELVGVLERLTLALKAPEEQANGTESKALPGAVGGNDD